MSYSAILFYGYVGVVGLALWALLKYFKSAVSLAQIWCTYGAALRTLAQLHTMMPSLAGHTFDMLTHALRVSFVLCQVAGHMQHLVRTLVYRSFQLHVFERTCEIVPLR